MPFYNFKCKSCETLHEEILSIEQMETFEETHQCGCGGDLQKQISVPYISMKGRTKGTPVNGYYSQSFGKHFYNKYAEQEYAERNGYVKPTWDQLDECMEKGRAQRAKEDERSQTWTTELKKAGGDKIKAAEQTFTVKNMKKWGDMKDGD